MSEAEVNAPQYVYIMPNGDYVNEWARPMFTDQFDEDGFEYIRADLYHTLAADRDAQKARADALEKARDEDAKDYCALMERCDDLIRRAEAAKAKVAKLVEVLNWTDMELAKLSGLWHDVSPRKQIRAAIAEVQE